MAGAITMEKVDRPELAKHESSILDLVFVMDCTSSMESYISSALNNIYAIVEEIVVSEKSDVHLALVEYRDHPPQDLTFVTRVHDFTAKVSEMRDWLQQCQAYGGGDGPEAVADGLHAVLKLSWRSESTKICILIADAPPHGLDPSGDGFPNGCPNRLDPVQIVREMAEKHITLYSVGVEPPIKPYRDFFMSLAYTTGGQYVPLVNAKLLTKVIIGGVREEISLERLMQAAEEDINREMQRAEAEGAEEKEKIKRISNIFASKSLCSTQVTNPFGMTSYAAKTFSSTCQNMTEMQNAFLSAPRPTQPAFATASHHPFSFGPSSTTSTSFFFGTPSTATSGANSSIFGAPSSTVPSTTSFALGAPLTTASGTNSSIFGASSTTASSTTFAFGASSTTASGANSSIFGAPSSTAPSTTSFAFGAPLTTASGTSSSIFGASSTTAPSTTSFAFGAPSTTASGANSSIFGAPSSTAPSTTTFAFGPPSTGTSGTNSSIFDASSTTAPSTTFAFGAPSTTASATNSSIFGASSTTASITAPLALATSTYLFGTDSAVPEAQSETYITYDVIENAAVNEDQAERIYQKWQHRKK